MRLEDRIIELSPNRRDALWGYEDWLVSCHKSRPSKIAGGTFDGRYLKELLPDMGLLVKSIVARRRLSVQVHPNKETQALFGGGAKTEMWCALNNGFVWAGLKNGVSREDIESASKDGSIESLLVKRELKRGEAILIPGGLVHAIGDNTSIYEVQQSADTTFRFYDWKRLGPDGLEREIHLAQALDSIDYTLKDPVITRDIDCEYFSFRHLSVDGSVAISGEKYAIFYVFEGAVEIGSRRFGHSESFVVLEGDDFEIEASSPAEIFVTKPR